MVERDATSKRKTTDEMSKSGKHSHSRWTRKAAGRHDVDSGPFALANCPLTLPLQEHLLLVNLEAFMAVVAVIL